MAVTWTIAQLERNTDGNGVVVAHWTASDSEVVGEVTHSGSSYGTCGFTPDATADGYVSYDSLTEADVIAWVKADLDAEAIEESIAAQITASKEPVTAAGVPW
tara:strand:- start:113 stop:421 length:309 start_codon:yes stop_codon:yes gene_type:complete